MSWHARSNNVREAILRGEEPQWLLNHPRRSYVRQRIIATPPWQSRKELNDYYAQRVGNQTVDHIIPLNHPRVCGLHVIANFRIVPRKTNEARNNAWCQWHGDLFEQPEQLRLL